MITRSEWLKRKGFKPGQDPFHPVGLNAERDPLLPESLVPSVQYQQLIDELTNICLSRFIFGVQGSGKTALRRWLHRYCDTYTGYENGVPKRILTLEYDNHDDYDFSPTNVTTQAHVDRVIRLIVMAFARIGHTISVPPPDDSARVRLSKICEVCEQFHIKHICVLVDRLDAVAGRTYEEMIEALAGLAGNDSLLLLPTICFYFFLPSQCRPFAETAFHLHKYEPRVLAYSPDEIKEIVLQRLTTYTENENRSAESPLGVIFAEPANVIERFINVGQQHQIRAMWSFGSEILDRFVDMINRTPDDIPELIPLSIVQSAYDQIMGAMTAEPPPSRTHLTASQISELQKLKALSTQADQLVTVIDALDTYVSHPDDKHSILIFKRDNDQLEIAYVRGTLAQEQWEVSSRQLFQRVMRFIDRLISTNGK